MSVLDILVSVRSVQEARTAARFPCVLDVKWPDAGSLGAAPLRTLHAIAEIGAAHNRPVSAALGDAPPWRTADGRGLLSLLNHANIQFVKLGTATLARELTQREVRELVQSTVDQVKAVSPATRVILASFADYRNCGGLPPEVCVRVAAEAGADGILVDTYRKRPGKTLFDYLGWQELTALRQRCAGHLLLFALAGSLGPAHVFLLKNIRPNYVGFRSAITSRSSRTSALDASKLEKLFRTFAAARELACG